LPEFRAVDTRKEITAEDWIGVLERVGDRGVMITGGEPFLYPNLLEVVNSVHRDRYLAIYSNLSCVPMGFAQGLGRVIKIRASYHPHEMPLDKFTQQVRVLAADSNINGSIHLLNLPDSPLFEAARTALASLPWEFHLEQDQRDQFAEMSNGQCERPVRCASKNILVGPDGRRYPCVSSLLSGNLPQEDLLTDVLGSEIVDVACARWGHCAPCDGLTERTLMFLDTKARERFGS